MKKIILILALCIATQTFAAQVEAVRGKNGIVEIGNSHAIMIDVLGEPLSSYKHTIYEKKEWPKEVTTYRYTIENSKYSITFLNGKVYKIEWDR